MVEEGWKDIVTVYSEGYTYLQTLYTCLDKTCIRVHILARKYNVENHYF
jgi:hypothetical protein